jgi:hypothetical protein
MAEWLQSSECINRRMLGTGDLRLETGLFRVIAGRREGEVAQDLMLYLVINEGDGSGGNVDVDIDGKCAKTSVWGWEGNNECSIASYCR